MSSGRGQSNTVGVLAVTVLVVALAVAVGTGVLARIDTASTPLLDADLGADGTDVTITHAGGDGIDAGELTVVLRDGRGNRTVFALVTASIEGDGDGRFEPGEVATHAHGFSGDVVEVLIVHGPTDEALVDETVDVETPGDGGGAVNLAPVADVDVSPGSLLVGQEATFDASNSTDPDGTITRYEWDWTSDGTYDATGVNVTHSYATTGTHTVTLRVTDDHGETDTVTDTVVATNTPPTAVFTYTPPTPETGESVTFDASASTDPDGTIVSYEWDWTSDGTDDDTGETATHSYGSPGTYTVTLRVTDDAGATDVTTRTVTVTDSNQDPNALFTGDRTSWWTVDLDASPSSDPDGTIVSYEWDLDGDGVYEESGETVEDANVPFWRRVSLRVTDDDGAKDTFTWWIFR